MQCAEGEFERGNTAAWAADKEKALKQQWKERSVNGNRTRQHKTQSSGGTALMAAAAAWETACVNTSVALLCLTMTHRFLKCCVSNNIYVSLASGFLRAVSVFSAPLAVVNMSRQDLVIIGIFIFIFVRSQTPPRIIFVLALFMWKYGKWLPCKAPLTGSNPICCVHLNIP